MGAGFAGAAPEGAWSPRGGGGPGRADFGAIGLGLPGWMLAGFGIDFVWEMGETVGHVGSKIDL